MSKQTDHEPEFTVLQTEINKAYHQQTLEQPSDELDEAILAKARSSANVSAKGEKIKKSLWQRNAWLFSSAASVLLVAGLFMLSPSLQQQIGVDLEQGLPTQPALSKQAVPQQVESLSVVAAAEKAIAVEGLSMKAKHAATNSESSINDSENSDPITEILTIKSSERPTLMSASPAQVVTDSAKQAEAAKTNDVAMQKKTIEFQSQRNDKEIQLLKQQNENASKGIIQLDTPDVALARLQALMAANKLIQAERYMITMDQRFPELSNPSHPLYEQYHKIKIQLTSK
ncbi:hypothetical protein [Shewanella polaris]|uniref:Uncharacterized protein n=1 Tax=Shewanella polaris TaxID=2588449 RepID=A0A4Y5YH16_9GAMM|nr:hypothetical protein [Shewanella polaris]QDE32092.1 hypothetical protein FH971_14650 [Shewanella polaris]